MSVTCSVNLQVNMYQILFCIKLVQSFRYLFTSFVSSIHYLVFIRLRAKKGPAPPPPPPPLGNFAVISYLEENFKPHLLRDVCTLCSGALVSDSLLHMLL